LEFTHCPKYLREKVTAIFVGLMLAAQAEWLTGGSGGEEPHALVQWAPSQFLGLSLDHITNQRWRFARYVVAERFAGKWVDLAELCRKKACHLEADGQTSRACKKLYVSEVVHAGARLKIAGTIARSYSLLDSPSANVEKSAGSMPSVSPHIRKKG